MPAGGKCFQHAAQLSWQAGPSPGSSASLAAQDSNGRFGGDCRLALSPMLHTPSSSFRRLTPQLRGQMRQSASSAFAAASLGGMRPSLRMGYTGLCVRASGAGCICAASGAALCPVRTLMVDMCSGSGGAMLYRTEVAPACMWWWLLARSPRPERVGLGAAGGCWVSPQVGC
jgi:hypothetical protein